MQSAQQVAPCVAEPFGGMVCSRSVMSADIVGNPDLVRQQGA
jgi:hypothetical protein